MKSRRSTCNRHPHEPVTGICASCLHERLSGLDDGEDPPFAAGASCSALSVEELGRCRSVSGAKSQASYSYNEPRRKSCDVRARNTLADFLLEENSGPIGSAVNVESKKLGFDDEGGDVAEGEVKTMKEHIDLLVMESKKHRRKPKDLASFWDAASDFSKKLQNWRLLKHKDNKLGQGNYSDAIDDSKLEQRKSGQREGTRLSFDAGRRISVDGSRGISFDEPRASWDGYLIARTIPTLTPMLSVVENGMLWDGNLFDSRRLSVDGKMQSIMEDESSYSGVSGQSNFDSSSSQRWSSFDRSVSVTSSSKKTAGLESDDANSMSPAKLVITERELKDWRVKSSSVMHYNCGKFQPIGGIATPEEGSRSFNVLKKSTRWGKMFNVLNMIPKSSEKKCENLAGNRVDSLVAEGCESRKNRGQVNETCGCTHTGRDSVATRRKSFDMFGFNQSMRNGKQVKEACGWKFTRTDSVALPRNSFDTSVLRQSMRNGDVKEVSRQKLPHRRSLASSRRSFDMLRLNHGMRSVAKHIVSVEKGGEDFVLELNKTAKNSSCKINNDDLPFSLPPSRSSRSSKSGRHMPENSLLL